MTVPWMLAPGASIAAVTPRVAALVAVTDRNLAADLWTAQHARGGEGVLDLLLAGGLAAVPDFVLIEVEDDSYRIVLRGKVSVVVAGPNDSVLEGHHARLASEHVIDRAATLHARCAPQVAAPSVDELNVLMVDGCGFFEAVSIAGPADAHLSGAARTSETIEVVSALGNVVGDRVAGDSGVGVGVGAVDDVLAATVSRSDIIAVAVADDDAVVADVDITDGHVDTDHVDTDHADTDHVDTGAVDTDGNDEGGDVSRGVSSHDDVSDAADSVLGDQPESINDDLATEDLRAAVEFGVDGNAAAPTVDDDGDAASGAEGDRYAALFGATIDRSVVDAALVDVGAGAEIDAGETSASSSSTTEDLTGNANANESVEAEGLDGDDDGDVGAHHQIDLEEIGRTLPPTSLVGEDDSVDTIQGVIDAPSGFDADDAVRLGDHDGHTITRSDIPSGGEVTATPGQPSSGEQETEYGTEPTVRALRCDDGHNNPPHLGTCSTCAKPLNGDPVVIPRPILGMLVFSNGQEVELNRPVIVGRRPQLTGHRFSELPIELAIDGGDGLSRSHALFSIADWQVRVEDLGSTNYTTVRLPGQEARRLRPSEPFLISDGALIDFGGEVSCRYDATI